MADICNYKIKVHGRKNACYAFVGSTSTLYEKEIVFEEGTDENYTLVFEGDCKWAINMYCHDFEGDMPVELPNDADEAYQLAEDKYWYHTVQERSEMFSVEVWCNSGSIEAFESMIDGMMESSGLTLQELQEEHNFSPFVYEHYKCGKEIYDNEPDEIKFDDYSFDVEDDFEEADKINYDEEDYESEDCEDCNNEYEEY